MALEVDTTTRRVGGVTFVGIRLDNPGPTARRARLANRLDGPVLPPRRRGTPEPGWDAAGLTVTVPAGGSRQRGYACPAPPADPPVAVAAVEPAGDAATDSPQGSTAARRDLPSARPPPDAVAAPVPDGGRGPGAGSNSGSGSGTEDGEGDGAGSADGPCGPEAAEAYLDAAERRIRRGERLTDPDVATATAALGALGGIGPAAALDDRLDADADRLRGLADRAARLADRAEAAAVPVGALRDLAGDPPDGAGTPGSPPNGAREGEP